MSELPNPTLTIDGVVTVHDDYEVIHCFHSIDLQKVGLQTLYDNTHRIYIHLTWKKDGEPFYSVYHRLDRAEDTFKFLQHAMSDGAKKRAALHKA